ncbi:MAG TPA: hypothetical protein VH561_17520 [Micromonosporaceae bacterium]|jgi:hypothetical protein
MPRRPASPVVIVLLAAIGALVAGVAGTATYLGVSGYLQGQPSTPGPSVGGGQTTGTKPSQTPEPTASQTPCPLYTIAQVQTKGHPGTLVNLLYVRGPRRSGSGPGGEGWICQDADGTLYYQGHDLDGRRPSDGKNTILVGGGIRGDVVQVGSTYVATIRNATYRVSCDEFAYIGSDGRRTDYQIMTCEAGGGPTTLAQA